MRAKKTMVLLLVGILTVVMLVGCNGLEQNQTDEVIHKIAVPMEQEKTPLAKEMPDVTPATADVDLVETEGFEDGINDSIEWLSYVMSIDIAEAEPSGSDMTPEGKFIHVTLTYITDDDGLGGFLFSDLSNTSDFLLTDSLGNVYEHLGVFSPISINITDGKFEIKEIQEVSGVFFDVPLDVKLGDLVFSIQ